MARRRRRSRTPAAGRIGRVAARVAAVVAGVLLVTLGTGYLRLRAYLHSEEFSGFLAAKATEFLGAEVRLEPFRWDGLQARSRACEVGGGPVLTRARADELRAEVGLGGVTRGVWLLRGANVRRLEVDMAGGLPPIAAMPAAPPVRPRGWLPDRVELEDLRIDESVLTARPGGGEFAARGQSWWIQPAGTEHDYDFEARGGTLDHPWHWFAHARLDHARFRLRGPQLFLTTAEARVYENGHLELSGEAAFDQHTFTFDGGASGVRCDEIVTADWKKRLTGRVGARFTVRGRDGATTVTGRLAVRDGVLTALPVLDRLAAYSNSTRFRVLNLSDARTDFAWRDGRLLLTNLVIASEGLLRLEGQIEIAGERLDGSFQLGLAPGTLATIPGAESKVFVERRDGLVWAPVRITGTVDHPQEDLSERLILAAGERMFELLPETGERVLKFTRTAVGEAPAKLLEEGGRAVGAGVGALREAGGIVRGVGNLFGLLPNEDDE